MSIVHLGLKKILFVANFRPTLSKHVRRKFILWILKKKKKKFQEIQKLMDELETVVKVTLKSVRKRRGGGGFKKCQKKKSLCNLQIRHGDAWK